MGKLGCACRGVQGRSEMGAEGVESGRRTLAGAGADKGAAARACRSGRRCQGVRGMRTPPAKRVGVDKGATVEARGTRPPPARGARAQTPLLRGARDVAVAC